MAAGVVPLTAQPYIALPVEHHVGPRRHHQHEHSDIKLATIHKQGIDVTGHKEDREEGGGGLKGTLLLLLYFLLSPLHNAGRGARCPRLPPLTLLLCLESLTQLLKSAHEEDASALVSRRGFAYPKLAGCGGNQRLMNQCMTTLHSSTDSNWVHGRHLCSGGRTLTSPRPRPCDR